MTRGICITYFVHCRFVTILTNLLLESFEFCAFTVFSFSFFFFFWICRQQGRQDFCLGFAVKPSYSYCKVSFLNICVIGFVFDQIFYAKCELPSGWCILNQNLQSGKLLCPMMEGDFFIFFVLLLTNLMQ